MKSPSSAAAMPAAVFLAMPSQTRRRQEILKTIEPLNVQTIYYAGAYKYVPIVERM